MNRSAHRTENRGTSRANDLDATLRSLDVADRHVDASGARARADLEAILASEPLRPTPGRPTPGALKPAASRRSRPTPVRRTARRVVVLGGVAAALAAGLVVLPPLGGGDRAFATWTAVPQGMSTAQSAESAADCRRHHEGGVGAGDEHAEALRAARPVVADRRGVWTTVLLAGPGGFSALCVTDDSSGLFTQGMIGAIGVPTDYAAPGPRELVATSLGTGAMSAGHISAAVGAAGSDVVGVVLRSRAHGDVAATVNQGHFALWFPGDELWDTSGGVEVEVTYADGTTGTSRLTL